MTEAFLDSSIIIGLHFRNAKEKTLCAAVIPDDAKHVSSHYVIFEIARGFMRSLLLLHNTSFEWDAFSELHEAAHSGRIRFQAYRMQTWLGAFDDYFRALEAADGITPPSAMLAELRAKLRTWARRGWRQMHTSLKLTNSIGCRSDLQPPFVRSHDRHLDQVLPIEQCGTPAVCGLSEYIGNHYASLSKLLSGLERLSKIDKETARRIQALGKLLLKSSSEPFKGADCHSCGDAFICHEASNEAVIVSKNRKHFEPICGVLGKAAAFS